MTTAMRLFFKNLETFLNDQIAPIGNVLDNDSQQLKMAFEQLIRLDALKLLIPSDCGGLGGGRSEWIEYNMLMAQYSGALLFLQAQHQFSIAELKKLLPNQSIQNFFKLIVETNLGLGISFAANKKLVAAKKSNDGFLLSGKLPWVTGFNYYSSVLFTFDLDDITYHTLLPFQTNPENKSIVISPKIEIAVLNATNTVSITLNEYHISNNEIIAATSLREQINSQHPAIYSFAGSAKALLNIAMHGKYKNNKEAKSIHLILEDELNNYHAAIINNDICPLMLRATGFQLAQKCSNFARTVCGAESLIASHPINRISREIWQYTIAGYSENQVEAYLKSEAASLPSIDRQ